MELEIIILSKKGQTVKDKYLFLNITLILIPGRRDHTTES
jgi:hypothetical protein